MGGGSPGAPAVPLPEPPVLPLPALAFPDPLLEVVVPALPFVEPPGEPFVLPPFDELPTEFEPAPPSPLMLAEQATLNRLASSAQREPR